MHEKKEIVTSESKSFNVAEFIDNVKKGAVIGGVSTAATFMLIDKPLGYATKAVVQKTQTSTFGFFQHMMHGNLSVWWKNSPYVQAYYTTLKHPVSGFPVALLNSGAKNAVFFPMKYFTEEMLRVVWPNDEMARYSGFFTGVETVYLTAPISVLKARMMTNVPLDTLTPKRLMSGVNAIALRDGIQFGIYFNTVKYLQEQYGDSFFSAGIAGILGYIFSNPFSVIGMNQKISEKPVNLLKMAKTIYKSSGPKGFYPLLGLSAFGMFARGVAIDQGIKLYKLLTNDQKIEVKEPSENDEAEQSSLPNP
ncbi:hypothetical protein [Legionella cardiaca]|uniref:Mitochondrial carrier protein n=1 Tax=Legionella cardiaca TaxID=1071983 RepID=A0ABY8AQ60_9GAMM|nr:hypothetical protein [Legionella cardiaca]WED42683.1 hypothetical protein PXX05_12365 [Legionella cardiaca]